MLSIVSLLIASIFKSSVTPASSPGEERERYWSGKPQAIGIDLSSSLIHAVHYNFSSGEYTNIASIQPSQQYGIFMYELYQRQKLNSRYHQEAWRAFEKWSLLRSIVQSTPLTSWIGDWVPQLCHRENFRYQFNNDLDADQRGDISWAQWARTSLPWQGVASDHVSADQGNLPAALPLSSINFISVLASALDSLKTECLKENNIAITSAVIAKPQWIYNELDTLIDKAFLKADIEILDKRMRAEAAAYIPMQAGKIEPMVLEQSGYDFRLSTKSSSADRADLSSSWIPAHLASEMLESGGPVVNSTTESLNAAMTRLVVEIAKTRNILRYGYAKEPSKISEEESTIVVPNFGHNGFTLTKTLSGASILRTEEDYIQAVQEAVETMLLNHDEVYQYRKANNLFEELEDDPEALRAAIASFTKTSPHPQADSGKSWWRPIDALLVLADFPEGTLINSGAMRVVGSILSNECRDIFDPTYLQYDLAARGAALEANNWVGYWEREEKERRCWEDDGRPECEGEEHENEEEERLDTGHEEL